MVVIAPDNFPGPIKRRANVFHVREKLEAKRTRVALVLRQPPLILCAPPPLFVPLPNDIIPIDHFRIRRRRRRRPRPRYVSRIDRFHVYEFQTPSDTT